MLNLCVGLCNPKNNVLYLFYAVEQAKVLTTLSNSVYHLSQPHSFCPHTRVRGCGEWVRAGGGNKAAIATKQSQNPVPAIRDLFIH